MSYSKLDYIDMMIEHVQDLRRSICGEPSADTLALWHLDDVHFQMWRDYYAQHEEELDDNFTFKFTSEVKLK